MNVGSEEAVIINQLLDIVCDIAGRRLRKGHINDLTSERGRDSHNWLIASIVGWQPSEVLCVALEQTIARIEQQVRRNDGRTA